MRDRPVLTKICVMDGVRTYGNGDGPVELWFNPADGRMVVVAYNEGGACGTEVDLYDIVEWLQRGPRDRVLLDHGSGAGGDHSDTERDRQGN